MELSGGGAECGGGATQDDPPAAGVLVQHSWAEGEIELLHPGLGPMLSEL